MALPIKNAKLNTIEEIDTFYNGGKGSGNFGHAGRPGEVGGSSSSGSSGAGQSEIDKKIERAKDYAKISSDRSASWVEEADREAARDLGLEPDTMAPTKGEFWREAIAILEAKKGEGKSNTKKETVFDDPEYEAVIAEKTLFRKGLPVKEIARRFGMEVEDVVRDIDDYPVLKKAVDKRNRN